VIDSDELLIRLCGADRVEAFKEVKLTSMRVAKEVKQVVAEELGGSIPTSGKQFLTTPHGMWRIATRANSDNTTEQNVHRRMGANNVQVFGELTQYRRERGWITLAELYEIHGVEFDETRLVQKLRRRAA
jgi:hypothetical protein